MYASGLSEASCSRNVKNAHHRPGILGDGPPQIGRALRQSALVRIIAAHMAADHEAPAADGSDEVVVDGVTKRFDQLAVVRDVTLRIPRGEFFSMLGPSGCGKTTTLRMIAGFEHPSEGRIRLGGADVTGTPPARRNVNMVFQAYALFPHMTVSENVAFGLRVRRLKRGEMRERLAEMHAGRTPGRAWSRDVPRNSRAASSSGSRSRGPWSTSPASLLLDEPLGALDLKLRKEMQLELKHLQERLGRPSST